MSACGKERVEAIVGTHPGDVDFSRFMRREASRSQRDFYGDDQGEDCRSFETCERAGSVEVSEDVTSASPDIVCVNVGTSFYVAGMTHPNSLGVRSLIWSRRLHRVITQTDVFAVPPDSALRRVAQSNFDNRNNLQNPGDPDGIPLDWRHASIGPDGITWSFGPYELGGYLSAGDAAVSWSTLRPNLRPKLAFAIATIRSTRRLERAEAVHHTSSK
jgi:hypothetical protein